MGYGEEWICLLLLSNEQSIFHNLLLMTVNKTNWRNPSNFFKNPRSQRIRLSYSQIFAIEFNIANAKIIDVVKSSNERYFIII
jgi:hypothetical protein